MVRFDAKLYSLVNFGSFSLSYGFSERESVFFDDFSTFFNQKNHEFSLKIQSFWLRKIKFFEPGPAGPAQPGPAQPGPARPTAGPGPSLDMYGFSFFLQRAGV